MEFYVHADCRRFEEARNTSFLLQDKFHAFVLPGSQKNL